MRGLKITVFGIITVSVDVRIVNPFVFLAIKGVYISISTLKTFGHCVIFSGKKITAPLSPNVPVRLY